MSTKRGLDPQLDMFVPMLSDIQLRDQRETMERPFFSLSKRKRLTPIDYVSPDGTKFVKVEPHQNYGMATIWDADLLIWAASQINDMKKRGVNDIPRRLPGRPYEILKSIGRDVGGENARQLHEAALRLRNTSITTNIRSAAGEAPHNFSWLSEVRVSKRRRDKDGSPVKDHEYLGFVITVSEWFYEAVLQDGALLSIDPSYFSITGGRERWLYRIVRKHAGGAGASGFVIPFPTLFEKSGAEGEYRRFKFEILKIVRKNALPGFDIMLEVSAGVREPSLRMIRKGATDDVERDMPDARPSSPKPFSARHALSDTTLALVRRDFPGLDIYALQADFDAWLETVAAPADYQKAFYGFCRRTLTAVNR